MASYSPPTENLAIFDSSVFLTGDEPLTYNQAVKKFLKYPNAQGTENLLNTNINGVLTLGDTSQIVWNADTTVNYLINKYYPKDITTGRYNVALGNTALAGVTSGSQNVGIGDGAGSAILTGSRNMLIGDDAGLQINTADGNVVVGSASLYALQNGNNNTCIGTDSTKQLTNGSENVSIGNNSNNQATDTTFSNSTAIGSSASNNNYSNSTALGVGATNTSANQIRLGRASETVSCPNTLSFVRVNNTDNTNYFIPFGVAGAEGQLFVDSVNGPFTYNPSSNAMVIGTGASGSLTVGGGTSGSVTTGNFTATNGAFNSSVNTAFCNGVTNTIIDFGINQNSGALNIGTNRTSGTTSIHTGTAVNGAIMNIYTGNYTGINGAILNIMTGNPTSGPSNINLLTGTKPVLSSLTIGGSANVNINLNSRTVFANPIVTNVTTAPTITNQLGYTTSKTSGWSNITSSASNINTITIDGAVIEFGVYKIDVFVNYTNGAANQNFRVGVSDTTLTLPTPLVVRSTQSGQDDGVFISQTISAFTNTTFYIVAQSSNAVGATLYTTGARTSGIYLTRIA